MSTNWFAASFANAIRVLRVVPTNSPILFDLSITKTTSVVSVFGFTSTRNFISHVLSNPWTGVAVLVSVAAGSSGAACISVALLENDVTTIKSDTSVVNKVRASLFVFIKFLLFS